MVAFLERLAALPPGHGEGTFEGRRYGVTLNASPDGRRRWLFAEELGGTDRISANLYRLADGRPLLKPCEMPAEKVVAFVLAYRPDAPGGEGTSAHADRSSGSEIPLPCKE
nr:hypothetical protein [Aureimonas leprariae]